MGWFKKKGDVLDLTKLQRQGVLQRSKEILEKEERSTGKEEDILDLTSSGSTNSNSDCSGSDFLSSLAGAGGVDSEGSGYEKVVDSLRVARNSNLGAVNELKNKIEDIEFKLDRFIERLDSIEREIESKIGSK